MPTRRVNRADRLLTTGEVAVQLHVHINTVRRWGNNGTLKCVRIGPRRDRRFRQSDIDEMLKVFGNE